MSTAEAWSELDRTRDRLAIVGRDPRLLASLEVAGRFAPSEVPLLIVGETGTGKELVARLVHELSGRSGPLVAVNCAAIPSGLAESVLFGHQRGAFTGAISATAGIVREANTGTLFLDELPSLPTPVQAKLLRVIESGEVRRVGGSRVTRVDVRLVAATQSDVDELTDQSALRLDLLQRVAGAVIRLPPLRDRGGDVGALAQHFANRSGVEITEAATALMERQPWIGNVRELRWTVRRAALLCADRCIDSDALQWAFQVGPATSPSDADQDRMKRRALLLDACALHDGDAALVARELGVGRSTLYRWLREFGLELRTFRARSGSPS